MEGPFLRMTFFPWLCVLCTCLLRGVTAEDRLVLSATAEETASVASQGAVSPAGFPHFSWDTLPVFWHAWGPEPFNTSTLEFINRFPLATIEKGMSSREQPAGRDAETKIVAAAKQIKEFNSSIKVLFYLNSLMDWKMYELHQYCLQHPQLMWVFDNRSQPVEVRDQHLFNMTSQQVRQVWVDVLRKANATGLIDGAFVDRGGDPVEQQREYRYINPAEFKRLTEGHRVLMEDIHEAFGGEFLTVVNHQDYAYMTGRMFERFLINFDSPKHAAVYADIVTLQHESTYPHIAEVHTEPCTPESFNTTLAGYLVGAGRYAYYGCTDGFSLDTGWLRWREEYSKPLGEPLFDARTITSTKSYCRPGVDIAYRRNNFWEGFVRHAAEAKFDKRSLVHWTRQYWSNHPKEEQPILGRKFKSGTCVTLDFNTWPPASCIAWADGTHTGSTAACV